MPSASRIRSIDIVRGVVMVLMAIDHVRVYSGVPAGGATAGVFFTRWVTHFCAPAFVFFAGTGAFLHGRQLGDMRALARFLASRGLFLVVLEVTIIRASWTFNLHYSEFVLAGVIWMLGWCMVLLAAVVRLRPRTVGIVGLAIIFLQQIFGIVPRLLPQPLADAVSPVWSFIYPTGGREWEAISILYVLVPWIGVMAAGYGFGAIVVREPGERRRLCLRIGLTATALYVVYACVFVALERRGTGLLAVVFAALSPSKYPASQAFLLMTLGPTIAVLPFVERARGPIAAVFETFGRVPLFYYLLHIPAIHVAALIVTALREGRIHPEWYATAPFAQVPPDHRWSLPLLYLVFALVVTLLYFPCRWYAAVKAGRRSGWMRFV